MTAKDIYDAIGFVCTAGSFILALLTFADARRHALRHEKSGVRVMWGVLGTILFLVAGYALLTNKPIEKLHTKSQAQVDVVNSTSGGTTRGTSNQSSQPLTVPLLDEDTRLSLEGVRGPLHKKKAIATLDKISGKTFCLEDIGYNMRFRKVSGGFELDATYPDDTGKVHQTQTGIDVQGYSDQYDAVMYYNRRFKEPRMVSVEPDVSSIKDMTYRTEDNVDSFTKLSCAYSWQ